MVSGQGPSGDKSKFDDDRKVAGKVAISRTTITVALP
jgi:hypothetical protein